MAELKPLYNEADATPTLGLQPHQDLIARMADLRDVSGEPRRGTVTGLAQRVQDEGSQLVLASDTLAAAQHALAQGWIDEAALDEVRAQKERDTAFLDAALEGQDDSVATIIEPVTGPTAGPVAEPTREAGTPHA